MAEQILLEYAHAMQAIAQPKQWGSHQPFGYLWRRAAGGRIPCLFEISIALDVEGYTRKGWRVLVYYRRSPRGFHPDNFGASLFIDNARVLAFDSGRPSRHRNTVGLGEPYYQKRVDHPHWHRPTQEASHGYVEPLDPALTQDQLWRLFLERANIEGAPGFQPPPGEQGELL
ncbi:hypothetical protein SAMN05661010_02547 [Modicisalibacter muralis]|uniref:Uncharacterized protein n=1 Tax=Modicisalibacter muralis TaxID=119000 RepID=A0A1G9MY35_9GAMM|nr:hypothetical protein [Halomonas muralis]SDL78525.1 hypothetical protein SAMN05661010_02547 [Halomonas muralis]